MGGKFLVPPGGTSGTASYATDNCHTFNWAKTQLLGRAQTKYAREFKEAWHSTDDDTINRHIDIPTVYLQLKTVRKNSVNNNTKITNTNIVNNPITLQSRSTTHSYNSNDTLIPNNNVQSSMTTHLSYIYIYIYIYIFISYRPEARVIRQNINPK